MNKQEEMNDYMEVERKLTIATSQWDRWKAYAIELQARLVKYEGGGGMYLNNQQETNGAERMAEAKRIAAVVIVAPKQVTEKIRAAVADNQDVVAAFMKSREWGNDAGKVRAVVVEFIEFQH